MKKYYWFKTIFVFFFFICFFCNSVLAISSYIKNPIPDNEETDISYLENVDTCVYVDLPQGCNSTLYFYENSSGSWVGYGNETVSEKGTVCFNFSIECGTTYYWKVFAVFNCSRYNFTEEHIYSFTSIDCPVSHVSPSNNSINNCPCCLALCARLTNISGDTIKFAFQSNYTGIWSNLEETRIVDANNTYCLCIPEFVWFNYTYYWRVVYNTGSGAEFSDIFSFKTAVDVDDCPCGESSGDTIIIKRELWGVLGLFGFLGFLGLLGIIKFVKSKK